MYNHHNPGCFSGEVGVLTQDIQQLFITKASIMWLSWSFSNNYMAKHSHDGIENSAQYFLQIQCQES